MSYHRLRLVPMFCKFINWVYVDGDTILDVGCGGLAPDFHKVYGDKYVGLDTEDSLHKKDVCGDAHDLSMYPDDSFDIVTLWSVAEHLYDPYKALCEATRVAKKAVIATTDYNEADKDRTIDHYYSWTPTTFSHFLGLFGEAKVWVEYGVLCGVVKK